MKKTTLLFLFIFALLQNAIRAQDVSALDIAGEHAYYVMQSTVFKHHIGHDSIEVQKDFKKDTLVSKNLMEVIARDFRITDEVKVKRMSKEVNLYIIKNITFHHNKVFLGIQFQTESKQFGRKGFALVELDHNLNYITLYHFNFHRPFGIFTIPPYYPIHFSSDNTAVLPILNDSFVCLYTFDLNAKNRNILPKYQVSRKTGILKLSHVNSTERVLISPLIYPVRNSDYQFYFQFPYPIINNTSNQSLDPYGLESYIDSIDNLTYKNNSINYINSIVYYLDRSRPYTIITSYQDNEKVYLLSSKLGNTQLDLTEWDLSKSTKISMKLNAPLEKHYYFLHEKTLFILGTEGGKQRIKGFHLNKLMGKE
jgi:hypothetical protein